MPTPLDVATLPRGAASLRHLLLQREGEHMAEQEQQAAALKQQAAELQAARNGLQELTLLYEKAKLRLDVTTAVAVLGSAHARFPDHLRPGRQVLGSTRCMIFPVT